MNKIYFKTSKFTRVIYSLLIIIYLIVLLYRVINGDSNVLNFVAFFLLALAYCLSYSKYVLSDSQFYIKNRLGGRYNVMSWSAITKISIDKKDIRIDFIKATGKSGFIVIRDVENKDKLYHALQSHLVENLT